MFRIPAVIPKAFRQAFVLLRLSNPLILASSTAFFTTFSLSPIVMILVSILGLWFKGELISKQLFASITSLIGKEAALQVEAIVNNFRTLDSNVLVTVISFVVFIIITTTLLTIIRDSIHLLWNIKSKPSNKLKASLIERTKGVALILSIAVLFLFSQLADGMLLLLDKYLESLMPSFDGTLIKVMNSFTSIFLNTIWLTVLFKILPDARVKWKVALPGGLLTALMFNIGKMVLKLLLTQSNIVTIYGASTSLALILLFIFYSSFIIYFGASFVYTYAAAIKVPVQPGKYAELYEKKVINPSIAPDLSPGQ
jgi:membrane protein